MAIDVVHDIQEVYRKVLQTMSRPGQVENIKDITDRSTFSAPCYKGTILLAMMLLDTEVSFHVVGENSSEMAKQIAELTLAEQKSSCEADYIFMTKDVQETTLQQVIREAKTGTLPNPQCSATIIFETKRIESDGSLCLKGPGIEDAQSLHIFRAEAWLAEREKANKEYPLGIDYIFVDEADNIVSLPRTTQITNKGVE